MLQEYNVKLRVTLVAYNKFCSGMEGNVSYATNLAKRKKKLAAAKHEQTQQPGPVFKCAKNGTFFLKMLFAIDYAKTKATVFFYS